MDYPMRADLIIGVQFPDFALPDVSKRHRKLSEILGGFPGVLIFIRGSFWPKDHRQLANYAQYLQPELRVNYCRMVTVSAGSRYDIDDLREAISAEWPFLVDSDRSLLYELEMTDTTDTVHGGIYIPYTFILDSDRTIYKIYNGWWYLGRPTVEEIRMDLRALLSRRPDWIYSPDYRQQREQYGLPKPIAQHKTTW